MPTNSGNQAGAGGAVGRRVRDLAGHLVLDGAARRQLGRGRTEGVGDQRIRTAARPPGGHRAGQVVDPARAVTLVDLHHEPGLIGVGLLDELLDEQRRLRRCVAQQDQPGLRVHGRGDQRHLTLGVELVGAQQGIECGELPGARGVAGVLRNEPEGVDQGADDRVVGPGHAVR